MSRGTGGFPVACWWYRRIWGGRPRLWWLTVESLCIMCCYLHAFEKASQVRPRKPVKEIFRAQVQREPPLCTSEDVKWKSKFLGCTTERLFEWLSFSCCVLKQWQLRIWAGEKNSFFSRLPHSLHLQSHTSRIIPSAESNWQLRVPVKGTSSLTDPVCVFCCVDIVWLSRPRWHMPRTTLSLHVGRQCRGGSADEPRGPCRGHVYLTPWPDSQSAVRHVLTAERGYDLRGHGGSGLTGSSLKRSRDTPALTDSVPVGGSE